jgi:hypothetical protein
MNSPVDVFVAESNVEMYLSRAYECLDGRSRDKLLRLLVEEESRWVPVASMSKTGTGAWTIAGNGSSANEK